MAFASGTFTRISGSNSTGGTVWLYGEAATLAAIRAANYLNDAADFGLADGDVVMIIASDGFGFNNMILTGSNFTVGEAVSSA
tara:strand:+ start:77 stop:325 length:249 start_codon:yes stop_codon:yes gene_type:complete